MKPAVWACALAASASAHALPMGSVDTWMLMADATADERSLGGNYALTSRDALGGTVGQWKSNDGQARRDYAVLSYTRLVHRWNLPHAQANVWFLAHAGRVNAQGDKQRTLFSPMVMADWETTRLYAGAGWSTRRAPGSGSIRRDSAYLRGGFSFYEAEYDELQPWLIAEGKTTRDEGAARKEEAALWLRVIHKRFFVELGADDQGRARFGLMVNY